MKWLDIAEVTVGKSNNEICNVECKLLECYIYTRNCWEEKKLTSSFLKKETHLGIKDGIDRKTPWVGSRQQNGSTHQKKLIFF